MTSRVVPDWTTPADLIAQLARAWEQGKILGARLSGEALFPLSLRLRRPDPRAIGERFEEVRSWIRALEEGSRQAGKTGYEVAWEEINHRQIGRNRMPCSVVVPSEDDALSLLGKRRPAERWQSLVDKTLVEFPALRSWLLRKPLALLESAEEWERILEVIRWFRDHPRSGLYLRQLDIKGVDTKFIEARRALVGELLDCVLPVESIDISAIGSKGFERRYGLRAKPARVRFRLLESRLRVAGLADLETPVEEFARSPLPVERVFITENEINFLAFPEVPASAVIFGGGYAVDRLTDARWLGARTIHYWGDIDTHGFGILDRLRASFPSVQSFLMDRATLLAHRSLWVHETERLEAPLQRLTALEQALCDDLRRDALGVRVRLEQERIGFQRVIDALAEIAAMGGSAMG